MTPSHLTGYKAKVKVRAAPRRHDGHKTCPEQQATSRRPGSRQAGREVVATLVLGFVQQLEVFVSAALVDACCGQRCAACDVFVREIITQSIMKEFVVKRKNHTETAK